MTRLSLKADFFVFFWGVGLFSLCMYQEETCANFGNSAALGILSGEVWKSKMSPLSHLKGGKPKADMF